MKVTAYKAVGDVPDLEIKATETFPGNLPMRQSGEIHQMVAEQIVAAMEASLPGGTISRIEAVLLAHRVNELVVSWDRVFKPTGDLK